MLNLRMLWMDCFSCRLIADLLLYSVRHILERGCCDRGFQHATKVVSHRVRWCYDVSYVHQWCIEKEPESGNKGWAKSKMVLQSAGGGSRVPRVGRVNITVQIVIDLTLSSYVKAITVPAGTRTTCWFKVGGIEPCDLCVSISFFLNEWSMSVMCSAKIIYVCCASGNAAKFHAPCLLQKMLSGR